MPEPENATTDDVGGPRLASAIGTAVDRAAHTSAANAAAARLAATLEPVPARVRATLRGDWLGIPLHPVLTDTTIGMWTASFVADVVGGRPARPLARRLVLLGCVSAVPTVATGLADWGELDAATRRVGVVHAAVNLTATAVYLRSYLARRRGRHGVGVAWALVAAGVATVGAHIGGLMVYGEVAAPDDAPEPAGPPTTYAPESVRIG